ncbi:unnamed protein product [Calypogeia fissa]
MDDLTVKATQKKNRKQKEKGQFSTTETEMDSPDAEVIIDNSTEPIGIDEGRRQSLPSNDEVDAQRLHFGEQRPLENKTAKKQRADKSVSKVMAQAQRDMTIVSAKRLKLAEAQDRHNLFTI